MNMSSSHECAKNRVASNLRKICWRKQIIFAKLFQTERTDILSIVILNIPFIKRGKKTTYLIAFLDRIILGMKELSNLETLFFIS